MKGSPDVNHAAITKKGEESRTAFPGGIQRIGAPPIHGPIKNGIEIPANKGGRRRVNLGGNEIEESISIWVPVKGIDTKQHETSHHASGIQLEQNVHPNQSKN